MAADVLHAARADFPASVGRSAELLQHELDRFETLLGDLLEISRHDAGVAHLEAEPVDLAALVRDEVDAVAPLARRRGVVFDTGGVPAGPVMVEADRRRVGRILRNLLTNAVDYGEGQPVHLRLTCDDEVARIGVRDHGPGLTRAQAERVFDRFWRADPSRTRSTGGTGLGLSIAAEDARLHGGSLAASGGVGQGSTFTLELPRVRVRVGA
jgi:two-component system sensor histidine kinase MtrB